MNISRMTRLLKVSMCSLAIVSSVFALGGGFAFAGEEEDDRVLVVFVFDKSCRISCDAVRPIFKQLKGEYGEKVKFVELDVSKDVLGESQKVARSLRVARFLDDTEDWYPAVGVFTGNRKKVKEILGAKPKDQYVQAIEKALSVQQKEGTTDKARKPGN